MHLHLALQWKCNFSCIIIILYVRGMTLHDMTNHALTLFFFSFKLLHHSPLCSHQFPVSRLFDLISIAIPSFLPFFFTIQKLVTCTTPIKILTEDYCASFQLTEFFYAFNKTHTPHVYTSRLLLFLVRILLLRSNDLHSCKKLQYFTINWRKTGKEIF